LNRKKSRDNMWKRALGALVLLGSIALLSFVWLGREKYRSLLNQEVQASPIEPISTPAEIEIEALEEVEAEAIEEAVEAQGAISTPSEQR
jgi:hypothetical protein